MRKYHRTLFLLGTLLASTAYSDSNKLENETDKRIKDVVRLYKDSVAIYDQKGPDKFWRTFAFLADEKEISFLKELKGYPKLPKITQRSSDTIDISYPDQKRSLQIISLNQQHLALDKKSFSIPQNASLKEIVFIVDIVESSLKTSQNPKHPLLRFMDSLLLPQAHAANTFASFGRLIGTFIQNLFGRRNKSQPTISSRGIGSTHALGAAAGGPLPSPEPAEVDPNEQRVQVPRVSGGAAGGPHSIPANLPLGSKCNVIYVRHGNKDKKTQDLTAKGVEQAQELAKGLQQFEEDYNRRIDTVWHSNYSRSERTAGAFSNDKAPQNIQVALRECATSETKNGVCDQKARDFINDYLKPACGGGKTIFIAGHGSFGVSLFKELGIKTGNYPFPDGAEARPYLLSSNDGSSFTLTHKPPL